MPDHNSVEGHQSISDVNDTVKAGCTHRARNMTMFLKPVIYESLNSFESPES